MVNQAGAVRGPKHSVKKGKTLEAELKERVSAAATSGAKSATEAM
jgi:hypothetical protein